MINLLIFGPPGAGKGTQADKLKVHFDIMHLSTGDILRGEINEGTELGKSAEKFMSQGKLVPDEVVIGMIKNILHKHKDGNGFILDGFPRTIPQAEALDTVFADEKMDITAVLSLEVEDKELIARLLNRGKTSGRKDDSNEETIGQRLQVYKNQTEPLKTYYKKHKVLKSIDGLGSIERIFKDLVAAVKVPKKK